jgi:tagaturonate reductase
VSTAIHTPVVQFGTSRFLQAHADLFIDEAGAGPITVVASSGSASGRARLSALHAPGGYPVIIRGLEAAAVIDRTVHVRSIARGLDVATDWPGISRLVSSEASFLISNTTEAGFAVPNGLVVDLAARSTEAPPSFPARLLALLAARFEAGSPGLIVLPTELVGRNGDTLKAIVLDLAGRSRARDALLGYIADSCVFANSLVDRIVSAPIEPAGAVAEPYALWAVEAQPGLAMPCVHPAIRIVADLEPYERLKIHILNLGHSVLAEHWKTAGLAPDATVRGLLAVPAIRAMLDAVYDEEVLPGFAARGMAEQAATYRRTTMERFANPFLDHRLSDIATGHAQKVDRRIAGFMAWVAGTGAPPTPRLAAIAQRHGAEGA